MICSGNLTHRVGTGTAQSTTMDTVASLTTNQLSGYSYDLNGNQTSTGYYAYDAENRLAQANAGALQYSYDSQNKRIWLANFTNQNNTWVFTNNGDTVSIFGIDGKLMGSYSPQPVFNNSQTPTTIPFYGSTQRVYFGKRLVQSLNLGSPQNLVQDRLESAGKYYPFGEQRVAPPPTDYASFATYTRDSVTGLDYADQRYYANQFGRFMMPDPSMDNVDFSDPGSWNAYTYANGDPANLTDPTGLTSCGDAKIAGGLFAGQTVSQVMTGTSGDDLLAQIIWHEGGTITATDYSSSAPIGSQLNDAYLLDLAALGTAVLNQNTTTGDLSYSQGFSPGTAFSIGFNNNRATSNSPRNFTNPGLSSNFRAQVRQHLLQLLGLQLAGLVELHAVDRLFTQPHDFLLHLAVRHVDRVVAQQLVEHVALEAGADGLVALGLQRLAALVVQALLAGAFFSAVRLEEFVVDRRQARLAHFQQLDGEARGLVLQVFAAVVGELGTSMDRTRSRVLLRKTSP